MSPSSLNSMPMKRVFLAWVMAMTACGGTTVVDPGGSGGSGGTGSGTGTGTSTGTSTGTATGTGTGGPSQCAVLEQAYLDAVQDARSCDPFIDFEECTEIINEELRCPCGGTAVNPGNVEAIEELDSIADQWLAAGCGDDIACPAIACEPALGGSCQPAPDGMTGICETVF